MPAQSPTLSPTLSAMVAGLTGVFGDPADLADQITADIGTFGKNTTAQTGKNGNGEREAQCDQCVDNPGYRGRG